MLSSLPDVIFLHGPQLARIFSIIGGTINAVLGFSTLVAPLDFTHFILGALIFSVGLIVIAVEAFPDLAPLAFDRLPDLRTLKWRGLFYAFWGLPTLGRDWGKFGAAAGLSMILAGFAHMALSYVNQKKGLLANEQIAAAAMAHQVDDNPTAFVRFDELSTQGDPQIGSYTAV